jgi:hypothetical protein
MRCRRPEPLDQLTRDAFEIIAILLTIDPQPI